MDAERRPQEEEYPQETSAVAEEMLGTWADQHCHQKRCRQTAWVTATVTIAGVRATGQTSARVVSHLDMYQTNVLSTVVLLVRLTKVRRKMCEVNI